MPAELVVVTALLSGVAAVALSPWLRQVARTESPWHTSGLHVLLACVGGAGAAALSATAAEVVGFGSLALACALLVTIDLGEHRLPDAILAPAYAVLLVALGVAAGTAGEWERYGRSLAAALVLGLGYLALARASRSGLGLGDVKLSGLLGVFLGWFGWAQVLTGTIAAFVLGGLFSLVLLATRRVTPQTAVAFGPWMIAGAVAGVAWGPWVSGAAAS